MKIGYFLFPPDFLSPVFDAPGAVFEAGATAFFSLFDVVITSFSVVFRSLWFLPLILVLLVPEYIRFVPVQELKRF